MQFDFLVVGAGFAGCVLAERLASQDGKRCLVVDRRDHAGGNAYDSYSTAGVLVHNYGPHYFRTNSEQVKDYLSQFTDWHPVSYRVAVWTDGRYWPFPINLNTFEQYLGRASSTEEMEATLNRWRIPARQPRNSEEAVTSQVGPQLFEMFYRNYTRKQWGCDARELPPSVCGRIPVRTNRDDRYCSESFQAMPRNGYHKLFARMLEHRNILLLLRTDYRAVRTQVRYKHLVYTGSIDEFYDYCFGPLPYRSLRFEREDIEREYFQPYVQVNFPNDCEFTRIVEAKHVTLQEIPSTTIIREYPQPCHRQAVPYYPVPGERGRLLYARYAERAHLDKRVTFVGRLATYQYYNMDKVVEKALAEWERLRGINFT